MVSSSPASRHYLILWNLILFDRDLLYEIFKGRGIRGVSTVHCAKIFKECGLFQMHDSDVSWHLGCKKTKKKTLYRFFWYGLKNVALHVRIRQEGLLRADHFIKYVDPCSSRYDCCNMYFKYTKWVYISRWDCPSYIHSDQGRTYESRVFKELCGVRQWR